ncbi:hypothetical protein BTM25_06260 [Actinomadura rubteroloni]|uniref:DUF6879 domain-containing protein n=1 Tax=Actinomadura rubteroloni TaxID=1926885 RepID=A0A2P4UMF8_9ACTN|nr:DUF6879 family protein [Actinomadura rubteroloni]POM26232.1 hypothetical protein BTM25_06260 [Actinomadura rubteroloni]
MRLAGDEWSRLLLGFDRSAFRLELHPVYSMAGEEEDYARFAAGEKAPPDLHYEWLDQVAERVRSGKVMQRVHVVRRPLSDYLRFEFEWGYAFNVRAGEDIRILDLTERPDPGLPGHDFWMFDDSTVVRMLYREDGTQIERDRVEAADLDAYRRYRDIALADAVPFQEYWPAA